MATTGLARPAHGTAVITQTGGSRNEISITGNSLPVKVTSVTIRNSAPLIETTGDSDTSPTFENAGLIYTTIQMSGAAPADNLPNIADMKTTLATANIETQPYYELVIKLASGMTWTASRVMLESMEHRWSGNAAYIGVAFGFKCTDTDITVT